MQDLLDPAAASPHVPTVPAELLRATIEFAPLGIAHFDPEGRVLFANDCLCRILGYTREQLATRTFFELTHADDQAECLALTQRLARGEVASYRQEKRFVRADGSFVWVCVTVSAARDGRGVPLFLIGMAEDISERREAERRRRQAEDRLRAITNAIPQLVWISDSAGRRSWFNDRWYEYTGCTFDECEGHGWHRVQHPEHRNRVIDRQLECFARGDVWEDSLPLRRADGTYRWFLARAVPIRDATGAVREWFGTSTDITDQVEALRLAREAKNLRDETVAVVAHDLRNPVHTITLAAATLGSERLADGQRAKLLSIVQQTAANMGRLLDDLLDVSRMDSGTFAIARGSVHPAVLLSSTADQFEARAIEKGVALAQECEAVLPTIPADRDRLMQVLSNLVGNALKFTPPGGRIVIACRATPHEVQFRVSDSGPGIPAENLPHLFERFWKAEPASRGGAGLGLAISRGIVEAHGGRIWAESAPGAGTTFRFTVPLG